MLINNKELPRACNTCDKEKTMNCPESILCYSTESKPHWAPKKKWLKDRIVKRS